MIYRHDALSQILASMPAPMWRAGAFALAPPWGFSMCPGIVSLYLVHRGRCRLELDKDTLELSAGEIVLLADGEGHRLLDSAESIPRTFEDFQHAPNAHANGTATGLLVYGHYPLAGCAAHTQLPRLLRLGQSDASDVFSELDSVVRLICLEQTHRQPGWQAIAGNYVHIVFQQMLRVYATRNADASSSEGSSSLLRTMDPVIGPAIGLIHANPERPWTVAALAREVNMSRSSFSDHFREIVGQPPLQYLTRLRMTKAASLLTKSELGVKKIASIVGYESASSFTSAFKRFYGQSPASYRKQTCASQMG